jgi:hypothetical protein
LGSPWLPCYKSRGYRVFSAMSGGMLRDNAVMRRCDRGLLAILLSLALVASGCSSVGTPAATTTDASAPAPSGVASIKDKMASFFSGSSDKSPQQVTGAQEVLDCPFIDIRAGASTLTIGPTASNGDVTSTNNGAMDVKYQGTFVRAARECAAVGPNVVMKVGVEGRIVVGPAGGPGHVDVPLRLAVVQETPAGTKPIVTKFVLVPVTVASETDNPTFTYIADDLTFPMPSASALDSYVVYIGFDPLSAQAQEKPKPKPKAKAKSKAKPTAPTG